MQAPSNGNTTFIYVRANVPSPQEHVGRDKNVTIDYEVYCDDACDKNSFVGLKDLYESEDSIRWYVIKDTSAADSNFDYDGNSLEALYSDASSNPFGPSAQSGVSFAMPTKVANNQIHLKISGGLPHHDKIVYSPVYEYLKYDPFNLGTNSHNFKIIFSSDSTI